MKKGNATEKFEGLSRMLEQDERLDKVLKSLGDAFEHESEKDESRSRLRVPYANAPALQFESRWN